MVHKGSDIVIKSVKLEILPELASKWDEHICQLNHHVNPLNWNALDQAVYFYHF